MRGVGGLGALPTLLLLAGLCVGFNLDVEQPRVFQGPAESQFGYRVLQRGGHGDRWLLVGAPWDGDGQGDIYKCRVGPQNSSCAKADLGAAAPWLRGSAGRLGMTLVDSQDGGVVACAPLWSQECGSSVFSPGRCLRLDGELRPVGSIAPTARRCGTFLDIVVLLDGSNSIYPWDEVQQFLGHVLGRFFIGPAQTQVGVLQYGERVVQEWALGQHPSAQLLLEAAWNLTRLEGRETRTAMAIRLACTESFSEARGGRPGAARLLLVVTDGESHDGEELPAALAECERRNITRYAIAVLGHYLRRQQDPQDFIREIKFIASDPDEKFFFNVTDEAALNDIVDALGDRIFSLEGTHGDNESAFELEMSQIGFSIHLLEDGLLFGMVGAHGWEGGVLEQSPRGRIVPARDAFREQFPLQLRNHAAYLGYAVSSLRLPGGQRLFVAGAPRFQHKGKVLLFQLDPAGSVTVAQTLMGEQIGSYFGSEVLALDLDGDGDSDLLLVAAPTYLGGQSREAGRVYLYRVGQDGLSPAGSLHPDPSPQDSRFGSALAAVPDLGQDGLAGTAVGAPLEDGHRGALYIFHGAPGTIRPQHRQRVAAAGLGWNLRYFGISVDGRTDMDGDGLVDVAVGAQGAAVVLRSRRIVAVSAAVTVSPGAISVTRRNCRRGGAGAVCLRARICFRAGTRGPSPAELRVDLGYNVSLEEQSPASRAAFEPGSLRLLRRRLELPLARQSCVLVPFHVLDPRSVKLECSALGGHRGHCSVGYPVFHSQAKVSFTLELEFSCSVLLDRAEVTLEATSDSTEATPEDNVVQLSIPIRYEPDLFLSSDTNLQRYELHSLGTFAPGPEFTTTVKVQNLGCYPVQNVTLHMALPALGHGGAALLSVTRVLPDNATCTLHPPPEGTRVATVPPEDLQRVDRLDCSNTRCERLSCLLGRLQRGAGGSVRLLRTLHSGFFSAPQFRRVQLVGSAWLGVPGDLLVLEEGAQRRELVLEVLQGRRVPVSLWILVGSALGGLLLLALLSLGLWRLGFFSRPEPPREEREEQQEQH